MNEESHVYVTCTEEGRRTLFSRETPAACLAANEEQVKPSFGYCSLSAHGRTLKRWKSFRLLAWIAWSQLVACIRGTPVHISSRETDNSSDTQRRIRNQTWHLPREYTAVEASETHTNISSAIEDFSMH